MPFAMPYKDHIVGARSSQSLPLIKRVCGLIMAAMMFGAMSPSHAAPPSAAQVRHFMAEYGTCIAKREPELASKFVITGVDFKRDSDERRRLWQRECLDHEELRNTSRGFRGSVGLKDATYRGAIAEALIKREGDKLNANDFSAVAPLTYEEPWALRTTTQDGKPIPEERLQRQRDAIEVKTLANRVARLGECVVRQTPAQSRAILAVPIDTESELQALKAVTPAIQQCIPKGQTVSFDRMSLRGAIAIAYYRLANAAQTTGAVK
jgi:hypothetical protein